MKPTSKQTAKNLASLMFVVFIGITIAWVAFLPYMSLYKRLKVARQDVLEIKQIVNDIKAEVSEIKELVR